MACTPDVWRLCSDQIPDVDRIVSCLRQNTPQLSNGCRAVFEIECERAADGHTARRARRRRVPAPLPQLRQQPVQPQAVQPRPYIDEDD